MSSLCDSRIRTVRVGEWYIHVASTSGAGVMLPVTLFRVGGKHTSARLRVKLVLQQWQGG